MTMSGLGGASSRLSWIYVYRSSSGWVQSQRRKDIVFFDHKVCHKGAIEQIISRHVLNLLGTL